MKSFQYLLRWQWNKTTDQPQRNFGSYINTWKLKIMLLNNPWVNKEIKMAIKIFLTQMKTEIQLTKTCEILQKQYWKESLEQEMPTLKKAVRFQINNQWYALRNWKSKNKPFINQKKRNKDQSKSKQNRDWKTIHRISEKVGT